jgi:hypothetical protein
MATARAERARLANHGGENLLVAQVHAVEVADGGHAGAKAGGISAIERKTELR